MCVSLGQTIFFVSCWQLLLLLLLLHYVIRLSHYHVSHRQLSSGFIKLSSRKQDFNFCETQLVADNKNAKSRKSVSRKQHTCCLFENQAYHSRRLLFKCVVFFFTSCVILLVWWTNVCCVLEFAFAAMFYCKSSFSNSFVVSA